MSTRTKTPTFVLELPLRASSQQAQHLRAHFEAARCLYNALLGEASSRLKQKRADPRWDEYYIKTRMRFNVGLYQEVRQSADKQERHAL